MEVNRNESDAIENDILDDLIRVPTAGVGLRNGVFHQLHRHLLPRVAGHPVRYHGRRHLHLPLRHSPADASGDDSRTELGRNPQLPLPDQRGAEAHTREKMVHGTFRHRRHGRVS